MQFTITQMQRFNADRGTYSLVTAREHYDSQITATDYEAELLAGYFGRASITEGNVASNRYLSQKTFRLHPSGDHINLNLVFPKPGKLELRLYLSTKAGFKPPGGDVWFMFLRDGEIWIGSMPELLWREQSLILLDDEADTSFQQQLSLQDEIKIATLKARDVFLRNRQTALDAIMAAGYSCEFDSSHELFLSRATQTPYVEAHHLVPMSVQKHFSVSLDVVDNIACLCPMCHRAVHHADLKTTRRMLSAIGSRKPILATLGISDSDLMSFYAAEEIT